jgi:hypothetical protein
MLVRPIEEEEGGQRKIWEKRSDSKPIESLVILVSVSSSLNPNIIGRISIGCISIG